MNERAIERLSELSKMLEAYEQRVNHAPLASFDALALLKEMLGAEQLPPKVQVDESKR